MRPVFYIAAVTGVAFILQLIIPGFTELMALTPTDAVSGNFWQFFTYMFMHGGIGHITINMFVLLIFGPRVEEMIGKEKFILLYLASGVFSGIFYLLLTGADSVIMMLGASGATYAVVAAFAVLYPKEWIMVYFVPLPAWAFLVIFFLIETVFGFFSLQAGVANWGHVGGLIAGALMMLYWKRKKSIERNNVMEYVFRV